MTRPAEPTIYLRKREYLFLLVAVSGVPPILSTTASNSSARGKTLRTGTRTGLILPKCFEVAECVSFEVVDGISEGSVQIVRWDHHFCKDIFFFIEDVLMGISMGSIITCQAAQTPIHIGYKHYSESFYTTVDGQAGDEQDHSIVEFNFPFPIRHLRKIQRFPLSGER